MRCHGVQCLQRDTDTSNRINCTGSVYSTISHILLYKNSLHYFFHGFGSSLTDRFVNLCYSDQGFFFFRWPRIGNKWLIHTGEESTEMRRHGKDNKIWRGIMKMATCAHGETHRLRANRQRRRRKKEMKMKKERTTLMGKAAIQRGWEQLIAIGAIRLIYTSHKQHCASGLYRWGLMLTPAFWFDFKKHFTILINSTAEIIEQKLEIRPASYIMNRNVMISSEKVPLKWEHCLPRVCVQIPACCWCGESNTLLSNE